MEILKTYNGTTETELIGGGTFTTIEWDDLLPAIKQIIRLRDDESIDGFIAKDVGLKIKLSRKKGRKKQY